MDQEHHESNGTQNDGQNKKNFSNDHGQRFPSRRTVFEEVRFGRDRWMKQFIAINGRD